MRGNIRCAALQVKKLIFPVLAAVLLVILVLPGCRAYQPIRIGLTAELSGRNSSMGVQSRNGARLAVEEINARGGVAGRPLELLVRDNQGSPERVAELDQELIDSGAFVLTGHTTSWESLAARSVIDARSAILFSPSAATPLLDRRDDHFFRLIPTSRNQATLLARYAYEELGLTRIATLDDDDNLGFAHAFEEAFLETLTGLGGQRVVDLHFSSKAKPDFRILVEMLRASNADGLLVVANDADTALVAQQVRLADWDAQLLTSNWAYSPNLINNGGRAVEGLILPSHFDATCDSPAYQQFQARYKETYGEEPAFTAALSYETIQIIARALEETGGQWQGLNDALTNLRDFQGLCGSVSLDDYGDAWRSVYLLQVREGSYQVIQTLQSDLTGPEDAR